MTWCTSVKSMLNVTANIVLSNFLFRASHLDRYGYKPLTVLMLIKTETGQTLVLMYNMTITIKTSQNTVTTSPTMHRDRQFQLSAAVLHWRGAQHRHGLTFFSELTGVSKRFSCISLYALCLKVTVFVVDVFPASFRLNSYGFWLARLH